jgi:hypothetical protein
MRLGDLVEHGIAQHNLVRWTSHRPESVNGNSIVIAYAIDRER